MIAIPDMEKPKHCGMCEFQDMCACILLREPIPYDINVLPDCPLIGIVTCGECKWWNRDYKTESKGLCERNICGFTEPTDFCSYGERRSDE